MIGAIRVVAPPPLTKELLFAVFLPGLLFEAAFNIDFREFRKVALPVTVLAIPGVVAAILLTGLGTAVLIKVLGSKSFALSHALVFGALIAATDPIAVVALFRRIKVAERLTTLIEGESLLNDGTAIGLLSLLLSLAAGAATSFGALAVQFVFLVAGGVAIGAAVGFVASRIIARIDDAMIEITITVIAAYGTFVLGEGVHVSGVIATVTAGMYCGYRTRICGMSDATKMAVTTFWSYVAFALNSVVFLLIGFEVPLSAVVAVWPEVIVAFVAVIVARAGVVWGTVALFSRSRNAIPAQWAPIITWGGMRGALSMVLALALPNDFPSKGLVVAMTYGVVFLSIIFQGLTIPWLVRALLPERSPQP